MSQDWGQTQRRSVSTDLLAPIGAGVLPASSHGENYFSPSFGVMSGHEHTPSQYRGVNESTFSLIGNYPIETVSGHSRTQQQLNTGTWIQPDYASATVRQKQSNYSPLGALGTVKETSAHGTTYLGSSSLSVYTGLAVMRPSQFSTGVQTYYLLVARDSVTGTPVRWVANQVSLVNAPPSPNGNPLLPPSIELYWTQ